jgi:large subunit ribosomal protein L18
MIRHHENAREFLRERRHRRVRRKIVGTPERPRLVVHKSNKNIQAHLVDDLAGVVLFGISSTATKVSEKVQGKATKTQVSKITGQVVAEIAKSKGIGRVVFDRGGHIYHGRVKALAEGAREGGLEF